MNLLLDTHIAIWAIHRPERLPASALKLVQDKGNAIYVSAVSIWEIAIKRKRGSGDLPPVDSGDAIIAFEEAGFEIVPISAAHCAATQKLDLLHNDPFDRLLIAQALNTPFRLMTRDKIVARYSDTIILV